MFVESLSIVGPGPMGAVVWSIDGTGARDGSGRMYSPYLQVSWPLLAGSLDSYVWTCLDGIWRLAQVATKISVSGGGSLVAMVEVCSGIVAITDGVDQLTEGIDLEETAPARAAGVLIDPPTDIFPGDSVAVYFTGTKTGLVGVLSLLLQRIE